jgi:hypothetical protein
MKKIILFFCFLAFLLTKATCQSDWAPVGATWYYTSPYSWTQSYYTCTKFESVKDTVIMNVNCRLITVKYCTATLDFDTVYLKQSGDSILYYNDDLKDFFLLYNFSAKVGDTIVVHNKKFNPIPAYLYIEPIDYFKYKVINVDSIEISGYWLKRQKITSLNGGDWGGFLFKPNNYVINKIGFDIYFFGRFGIIALIGQDELGELRCYSDSLINYVSPDWGHECDYINTNVNNDLIKNLTIFPNPAGEYIILESGLQNITGITIYDKLGRKIITNKTRENKVTINLETIPSGMYFLGVNIYNNIIYEKFIKR